MTIFSENLNTFWCSLIVEEFVRHNIFTFCISPGSRSTPLAVAIARHPATEGKIFLDERAAAFFALGYARASGKVAPLISTSGTAVANYFPAVIESSLDFVPLLILSADRPPELKQTGANQTIQQTYLFNEYVRWQFELPCPDEAVPPAMVLTTVDQAIYQAHRSPSGPVHINCMFREPLEPSLKPVKKNYSDNIKKWLQSSTPFTSYIPKTSISKISELDKIVKILNATERGFLSIGQLRLTEDFGAIIDLIKKLNWPWYADITSSLRIGETSKNNVTYFDLLLSSKNFAERFNPETILHLGGRITSKRYLNFLEKNSFDNLLIVRNDPSRYDPGHVATHRIETVLSSFSETISDKILPKSDSVWNNTLIESNKLVEQVLKKSIDASTIISQPAVMRKISQILEEDEALFLANSLSIREMDWYAVSTTNRIQVAANRGASGIDGTIASALGVAYGQKKRLTLVVGDIALIHDLNSLFLIKESEYPITIILINNQGGGIFSFLPIAKYDSVFKKYFVTPHQLNFKHAADFFHLNYTIPSNMDELIQVYQQLYQNKESGIIEIPTDSEKNFKYHTSLLHKINAVLTG